MLKKNVFLITCQTDLTPNLEISIISPGFTSHKNSELDGNAHDSDEAA